MKISSSDITIERSQNFEESFFDIGDKAIIFEILRSKLYSNANLAVAREIMSNARDAHTEIGKNEPIIVQLPTLLDPNFRVKDFGPGITKQRMYDIVLSYGKSTKRDDNLQIGGMGLGMKSPWALTSSFTITSIVDGVKSIYTAYIDETKIGKLALLEEKQTDEPNGTEVCVPIETHNIPKIEQYAISVSEFWDIKPIIKNLAYYTSYNREEKPKILFSGTNWFVPEDSKLHHPQILIGKVPYNVDLNHKDFNDLKFMESFANKNFVVDFDIGELDISANRESITLTPRTIIAIKNKIVQIEKELENSIQDSITNAKSILDASVTWSKIRKAFYRWNVTKSFTWNGNTVYYDTLPNISAYVYLTGLTLPNKSKYSSSSLLHSSIGVKSLNSSQFIILNKKHTPNPQNPLILSKRDRGILFTKIGAEKQILLLSQEQLDEAIKIDPSLEIYLKDIKKIHESDLDLFNDKAKISNVKPKVLVFTTFQNTFERSSWKEVDKISGQICFVPIKHERYGNNWVICINHKNHTVGEISSALKGKIDTTIVGIKEELFSEIEDLIKKDPKKYTTIFREEKNILDKIENESSELFDSLESINYHERYTIDQVINYELKEFKSLKLDDNHIITLLLNELSAETEKNKKFKADKQVRSIFNAVEKNVIKPIPFNKTKLFQLAEQAFNLYPRLEILQKIMSFTKPNAASYIKDVDSKLKEHSNGN